jgi:pSer/pThr/pTyr-binding forkhead associated (FHA) protein
MSKLVLFLPDGTTLDIRLKRERMTIGRRPDNEICLPNLAVSGEHASVVTILDDSFLEDLGSTNGTLVNDRPIAKHFLREGDLIDIGRHKLVYCTDDHAVLTPDLKKPARVAASDLGERVEPVRLRLRAVSESDIERTRRNPAPEGSDSQRAGADSGPRETGFPPVELPSRRPPVPAPVASVKLISGPNTGNFIPLTKQQTTIGRPGLQVAVISRIGDAFNLKSLEGDRSPLVNGQALADEGVLLMSGDVIEIAGSRLEFVAPSLAVARQA